jgi:tripartite-type tricarboxylate transporter receptor subunit TctC
MPREAIIIMVRCSIGAFSDFVRQISEVVRDFDTGRAALSLHGAGSFSRLSPEQKSMTTITLHRRKFLQLAGIAAAPMIAGVAKADAYPTHPVRIVAGYAPGGGVDITARLIGQWLSDRLGQPFIIENKPGAASNIATEHVIRALPDGYTLQLIDSTGAINATLYDNLTFNFMRDMAPIAGILSVPNILMVHSSVPARNIPEFIAYAKANPGKLNVASAGTGTSPHLSCELFKLMAGVDMVHVPYRGMAPALNDLLGGQVQASFATASASIQYVTTGKLNALAVTTASRCEALPNIPAVAEFLPGYAATTWYGLGAPRNTPTPIIDALNKAVNAALVDTKMRDRLSTLAGTVLPGSPADLADFIAEETEKWGKVIRLAGIKPE